MCQFGCFFGSLIQGGRIGKKIWACKDEDNSSEKGKEDSPRFVVQIPWIKVFKSKIANINIETVFST